MHYSHLSWSQFDTHLLKLFRRSIAITISFAKFNDSFNFVVKFYELSTVCLDRSAFCSGLSSYDSISICNILRCKYCRTDVVVVRRLVDVPMLRVQLILSTINVLRLYIGRCLYNEYIPRNAMHQHAIDCESEKSTKNVNHFPITMHQTHNSNKI